MSITNSVYAASLTTKETVANVGLAASQALVYNGLQRNHTCDGVTGPQPSAHASFNQALSTGAATIDLTNLPGAIGTVNGNGLKVLLACFRAPVTNANPITIKFGAANPYNLLGASWQITLQPGQHLPMDLTNGTTTAQAPAIGGSAKNIDLSGTGSQTLDCEFVMG